MALVVLAVALVLGGVVGVLVARDPGYVLLAYEGVAVETSLWFAIALLVVGALLIRLVVAVLVRLARGRGSLASWSRSRRERSARQDTVRGLLLMAEGRWAQARKLLEFAADRGAQAPLINYLSAARAAQKMGDHRGRDDLLRAADASTPGAHFAVGLTQAELQREEGQWEQCLATLLQLYRQAPRHERVLHMLTECYRELADWQAVLELLPDLKKHRVLDEEALRELELEAWEGRIGQGREPPSKLLERLPRDLKREPRLVAAFARGLVDAGQPREAEALLRNVLDHAWHGELVRLYGTVTGADPDTQLVAAQGWLKERPNDPDLLLTLGRVSLMNRQWAQAREYFEASLRLRRSAQAQSELGRLCAALGDARRGSELLSQALEDLPALPLPEPGEAKQG